MPLAMPGTPIDRPSPEPLDFAVVKDLCCALRDPKTSFFPPILCLLLGTTLLMGQDGSTGKDWPHYGGSYQFWRYSALDQINRANIKKLAPVWAFQTGVEDGGLNATPIVVDGVMYLSSSWNRVLPLTLRRARKSGITTTRIHARSGSSTAPGTVASRFQVAGSSWEPWTTM